MQLTFYPKEKSTVDSAPSDYIVSKVTFFIHFTNRISGFFTGSNFHRSF